MYLFQMVFEIVSTQLRRAIDRTGNDEKNPDPGAFGAHYNPLWNPPYRVGCPDDVIKVVY
jgi:hypothetical protein